MASTKTDEDQDETDDEERQAILERRQRFIEQGLDFKTGKARPRPRPMPCLNIIHHTFDDL